jgi:hypothetical protein
MRRTTLCTILAFGGLLSALSSQTGSLRVTVPSPTAASLGRFGDVPVSLYTGVPDITVPIFTLTGRTLSLPISLRYHAGGIRVEEIASWVGLGWTLEAGGVITRTARGRVDEKFNGYYFTGNVWYDNANWPTFTNDNVFSQVVAGQIDGDPDQFFFSFAGRSGQFVMGPVNTSGTIEYRTIPSQKLRIVSTIVSNSISRWDITTEDGTKYAFDSTESHWDYTTGSQTNDGELFVSSWYLTKIISPGGDTITLHYKPYQARHRMGWYHEDFSAITGTCTPSYYDLTNEYQINAQRLDSIKAAAYTVHFVQGTSLRLDALSPIGAAQQEPFLDKVTVTNASGTLVRVFQLGHDYFPGNRLRLTSVAEQDAQGVSLPPYTFTYDTQTLPDRTSKAQDHWGYYNGKTSNTTFIPTLVHRFAFPGAQDIVYPGADRSPDASFMKAGVLTKITYPTGGYNEFVYEANDYSIVADGTPLAQDFARTSGAYSTPYQGIQSTTMTVGGTATVPTHVNVTMFTHESFNNCQNGDPLFPCPWGEIVGVGKWYPGSPPYNALTSYSFSVDVALAPGTYTLQTSAAGKNVHISIDAAWNEHVTVAKKTAGGLRVTQVNAYDPSSGTTTIHKYQYTLQSDPTKSSGIIGAEPKYDYEFDDEASGCSFYSRSSASKIPLGSGSIGEVAYREVTVLDGANGEFGKTRHVFRSMMEWPDGHNALWPAATRTSYAWERGQTKETDMYNATGQIQRKVTATYTIDGLGPVAARRFRGMSVYQAIYGSPNPAHSYFFSNAYEVVAGWLYQSGETATQYDTLGNNPISSTKTFVYGNPNHLQLTEIDETNSDGTQRITRMKYPADYSTGSGNPEATALTAMQGTANIQNAVIERWVSVISGGVGKVVSAELTTYKQYGTGQYLPYQRFILNSPGPVP